MWNLIYAFKLDINTHKKSRMMLIKQMTSKENWNKRKLVILITFLTITDG